MGSTVSVSDGTKHYNVNLVRVIDPAQGDDQYVTADAGKRFVGVEVTIAATNGSLTGNANSDVTGAGSDNQTYSADFDSIAGCTNFNSGEYTIAAGASSTGCVTLQVPSAVKVVKVQFSPSAGFDTSGTVGQWDVP